MTREQAIETCAKAFMRRRGYCEALWQQYPVQVDFARDLVAALEALGLLTPTPN
jgi:hypothetical protein